LLEQFLRLAILLGLNVELREMVGRVQDDERGLCGSRRFNNRLPQPYRFGDTLLGDQQAGLRVKALDEIGFDGRRTSVKKSFGLSEDPLGILCPAENGVNAGQSRQAAGGGHVFQAVLFQDRQRFLSVIFGDGVFAAVNLN
jgi:hypothetical protein